MTKRTIALALALFALLALASPQAARAQETLKWGDNRTLTVFTFPEASGYTRIKFLGIKGGGTPMSSGSMIMTTR